MISQIILEIGKLSKKLSFLGGLFILNEANTKKKPTESKGKENE